MQIRYQTYDPNETYEIMEALLGKQDSQEKPAETKEDSAYSIPEA